MKSATSEWSLLKVIIALTVAVFLAALVPRTAAARTSRDASGRLTGTATTDSNGTRTFRDGSGRLTGTATRDSNGTTTLAIIQADQCAPQSDDDDNRTSSACQLRLRLAAVAFALGKAIELQNYVDAVGQHLFQRSSQAERRHRRIIVCTRGKRKCGPQGESPSLTSCSVTKLVSNPIKALVGGA